MRDWNSSFHFIVRDGLVCVGVKLAFLGSGVGFLLMWVMLYLPRDFKSRADCDMCRFLYVQVVFFVSSKCPT